MVLQRSRVTTTTSTTTDAASEANPFEQNPSDERRIGSTFVPREIIKFELADAKIPDFQQQRYQTRQQNTRPRQRKARRREIAPTTESVADVKSSNDDVEKSLGDQSSSDTRVLMTRANVKQLPFSVQKAINHALKQDYNIPFLDTIKYYFKDPQPKSTKLAGVDRLPAGAKLVSDSRIRQWWQLPPSLKSTSTNGLAKISGTTVKPIISSASAHYVNDYVAHPLLRTYPVQYSMNVASDLVNGVGFLYGDRIYSKPYTYQKNVNSFKSTDVKPVVEPKPFGEDDVVNGIYSSTQSSILSTSPIVFQTSSETPKTQSFIKYYSAELPSVPTNPDTGMPLSNDKNTIHLINKAVNELKKHNPHLNVVPKRLERDELVVHVTPKPEYFSTKATTQSTLLHPSAAVHQAFKDIANDKNLVYLNKVANSVAKPHIAGHAFVTHSDYDDLVLLLCKHSQFQIFEHQKMYFFLPFFLLFRLILAMHLVIEYAIIIRAMILDIRKSEWLTEQHTVNIKF